MQKNIPSHDFSFIDTLKVPFNLVSLEKKLGYDFSIPHRHHYYEMFFFMQGGGIHEIDFESIEVKALNIHFISPGQIHLLKREPNSYGYVIHFTPEFLYLTQSNKKTNAYCFLNNSISKKNIELKESEFQELISLLNIIRKETKSNSLDKYAILRSYLEIILLKCKTYHEIYSTKTNIKEEPLINTFKNLIEKQYKQYHLVKEYANELAVSAEYLNQLVSKQTGKTAHEWIHERILLEAKRLLWYSNMTVKEIAFELNFSDSSYFNRFFKKNIQLSPFEFRVETRMKYSGL
jgi:AraC-like DNA-binding protein